MKSTCDYSPVELSKLNIMVLEPDTSRAVHLMSRFRALGIDKFVVVSSLRDMSAQIIQGEVDVLVAEIRYDSNDGLMLPSCLQALFGAAYPLQSPRLLWIAEEAGYPKNSAFIVRDCLPSTASSVCIKALNAHAQLARNAGFTVATLFSTLPEKMSETLHAVLAVAKRTGRHEPRREGVPSEEDVIEALTTGKGLRVVFQPQHDLASGDIVGAEALIRWRHALHGDISPAVLIPMVSRLGLHLLLFSFVKARVLEMLKILSQQQLEVPISVNASVDTVCTGGFSDRLDERMKHAQLPNHLLKIELTEDIPVMDELKLSAALNAIKIRGFGVSLDDFGSGSATLRQIARMPFDEVKIDGALIKDLDSKSPARRIVATTLALARRLNMTVVAEGIETDSCRVLLRRLGCRYGQGFFMSRPMDGQSFLARLTQSESSHGAIRTAQVDFPAMRYA